jgi:CRISPR/Cas system-associated exonuclease Cas4 (RecB family)
MVVVSNTQVTAKNLCDRAHKYRFIDDIEPKQLPPALYRGLLGHSALEQYYLLLKDGKSVDECQKAALAVIDAELMRLAKYSPYEFQQIDLVMKLRKLINDYAFVYKEEKFKVLEVEKEYRTPVDDDIDYALRIDILVEMTAGEFRGDFVVVDHKFVYNFKTPLDIAMDAQLPKYIYTLRKNGIIVTKGMFNQIRTREIKDPGLSDLYKRSWVKSKPAETARIWKEQKDTAHRIQRDKDNGTDPVRTLSLLVCRQCLFQKVCKAELDGDDVTQMIKANYQKSTYGYTDLSDLL